MASFDQNFIPDMKNSKATGQAIFQGPNYRITILSERLIRLEYSKDGVFSDALTTLVKNRKFGMPAFKVEQDQKYLVINTKYFMLQYIKNKPFEGPKFAPDSNLRVTLLNTDKVWFYGQAEARNFKGGAESLDDYRGMLTLDKGILKLDKGLYSTDGFVLVDDSKNLEISEDGTVVPPKSDKVDLYLFMYKRDFGLCLKDYYTLTGYPDLIPRYALGIWWNKERIYNEADIQELIRTFNRFKIPISVLLLSEFWHIKDKANYNLYRTGFSFNRELFPDPGNLVKYLHYRGVRLGLHFDPSEGLRKEEDRYQNFAQELNVADNITIPYNVFDKNFMALYVKHLINYFLELDVDVFWLDYRKSNQDIEALGYYYNKDFENVKSNRPLLLARNSLVAPHKAGILYSGQTIVSWNTLKFLPFFNSMAANKGVTWWSHDVGGYKEGTEDSELYMRYIQFSCFSPIFRFSSERGNFYKREPWAWDVKTYTIAREYCQLRQRLIPYLYTEACDYAKNGRPLIQPIYYAHPEIYDEPNYRDEYYFGKEMFVSPITKPMDATMKRSVERIYLPKGTWYDLKTGKKFIGDKRYVVFYREEEYPVFVKSGAIIPFGNLSDTINDTNPPKSMEIDVFPGKSNSYKLYEDDGVTKLHQGGFYIVTAFDYSYQLNNYTLNIYPMEGKTEIIPATRDYTIKFRNTRTPDRVDIILNEGPNNLPTEMYQDENDFIVEIKNVPTTGKLSVNCKGHDMEINAVRIINEDINSIISDLAIETKLKEQIATILFSDMDIKDKRIQIKKIHRLDKKFVKMFIKLLEYIAEI